MQELEYSKPSRAGQAPHGLLSSVPSPSQNRKNIQGLIPHGTVASRVMRLQGISRCFSPETLSNINKQSPENSTEIYGHREVKQLSQPPQRDLKSSEDVQFEAVNSSRGLSTIKPKFDELYAIPDMSKGKKQPEVKNEIKSQRPRDQLTRNFITSICREPSSGAFQAMNVIRVSPDVDKIEVEIYSKRNRGLSTGQNCVALPSSAHPGLVKLELDSQAQLQKIAPNSPFLTASTQSERGVRDLSSEYVIERSSSFASEGGFRPAENTLSQEYLKTCHLCSHYNRFTSVICKNCCHRLCIDCELIKEDEIKNAPKKELNSEGKKEQKSFLQLNSSDFVRRSRRPRTAPIQASGANITRESTNILENNLYGGPSSELNKFQNSSKSPQPMSSVADHSVPFLSGRNVTKNVKESPFLARDTSDSDGIYPHKSSIVESSMNQPLQNADVTGLSLNSIWPDRSRASWFKYRDINSNEKSSDTTVNKPDLAINGADFPKKDKEIIPPRAEYQSFMNKYSRSDAAWSPKYTDSRDTLRVLPITKSVSVKGNIEQPRTKISLHDRSAKINGEPKPVKILLESKEDNTQKVSGNTNSPAIRKQKNNPLNSNSEASTINCNLISQPPTTSKNGCISNDNEKKKQRRLTVAKKIKDGISQNLDLEKSDSEIQAGNPLTTQNSRLGMIKGSDHEFFDLPPLKPENRCSIWKLCSEGNLTDIVSQKIKGVALTLKLEGGKDIIFKAKTWDCGEGSN